jgi:hypothetical protein
MIGIGHGPPGATDGDRRAAPDRPARGRLLDRVADWDRREATARLVARADQALCAAKEGGRNRSHAAPTAAATSAARTPTS